MALMIIKLDISALLVVAVSFPDRHLNFNPIEIYGH